MDESLVQHSAKHIELLRDGNFDIRVIGTNENEYSVIKNDCDEWYQEPVLQDEEYVEYSLDFCRKHDVQVFLPRRGMLKISEQKHKFEETGVHVMMDNYGNVSMLNHKEAAYGFFRTNKIGTVPDYCIVTTTQEFSDAYDDLRSKYEQVCFKFAKDEGGKSFRLIDYQRKDYTSLFKKQKPIYFSLSTVLI